MQNEEQDNQEQLAPVEAQKQAFMDHFEKAHSPENQDDESDKSEASTEQEKPAPSAEKKDESVQKSKESEKQAPEGYVRKEALDEERSRRKRLSQKLKEFEQTYEQKMKDLEARISKPTSTQSEDTEEEADPKVKALQDEIRNLRELVSKTETTKKISDAEEREQRIAKQIADTDRALKDEGYPGFKLGVHLVDKKLKEMLLADEIDETDYQNPAKWKEVYISAVYSEVAEELGAAKKKTIMNEKTERKKDAAKVTGIVGVKGETKKESDDEDEELTPEQEREQYLRFKNTVKPKLRY